ncbi:Uncharacterised protein [Acinetobacter baumannii]|nr:Uncharacterised protein [Acinetobacter baumannii]
MKILQPMMQRHHRYPEQLSFVEAVIYNHKRVNHLLGQQLSQRFACTDRQIQ